jgi:rare lipoprotein A
MRPTRSPRGQDGARRRRTEPRALLAAVVLGAAVTVSVPATASQTSSATGPVAWYGPGFVGRLTANGERFDPDALTMAHRTLPFGTRVRITNLRNQKSVVLRVNDRGPFTPGRIADVSPAAARLLDMLRHGVVPARLEVLSGAADGPPGTEDRPRPVAPSLEHPPGTAPEPAAPGLPPAPPGPASPA